MARHRVQSDVGTYSIDEFYSVPVFHRHLLVSALLLIAIAAVAAFIWDRRIVPPGQPLRFKGRFGAGISSGCQASTGLAVVMAISVEMPSMPWIESRSGSLWEAGQFVVIGTSVGLWVTLTVGLPAAAVVAALASWMPRIVTPARGLVVGLAIALAITSMTMRWLVWCGNVPLAQRALASVIFSTAGLVAGAAAGWAASRTRTP
jgi:hypothetical protein